MRGCRGRSRGLCALKDTKDNILMYYAPDMGKWMFAGVRLFPPTETNLEVRLGGSFIENMGVPYNLILTSRWADDVTRPYWRSIRNYLDWNGVAKTMGETVFHFEDYVKRAEAGETFTYQVKAYNPRTGQDEIIQVTNSTPVRLMGDFFINNKFSRQPYEPRYWHSELSHGIYLDPDGFLVFASMQQGSKLFLKPEYEAWRKWSAGGTILQPLVLDDFGYYSKKNRMV